MLLCLLLLKICSSGCQRGRKKLISTAILDSGVICHSYYCVSRKWQIQRLSFISLMELKMNVVQAVINALLVVMDYGLAK